MKHTRKKSIKNFILPKNIDVSNEKILFKDKLQLETKNKNINLPLFNNENSFLKDIKIQENSIKEEDSYNLDIYNKPILRGDNFLKGTNNENKNKTIQVNKCFNTKNKNRIFLEYINFKKYNSILINGNHNFGSYSMEFYNNNINLKTIEDDEKGIGENINYLMKNIDIFSKMHKERKNDKLINQIITEDNKSNKNIFKLKNNKYAIKNKYSKKYKKLLNEKKENNFSLKHFKGISHSFNPFNGPYLRKNNVSQINYIKNVKRKISHNASKCKINIIDEDTNQSQNTSQIKAVTKSLYNRYSQIDTNIYDHKIDITNDKVDDRDEKINKNKKIKIITSSFYDLTRKDFKGKNNNMTQKERNYVLNLNYSNKFNNKHNNNIKSKGKSKSKSIINEYSNFNEKYIINNENNILNQKEKSGNNKIIKKRVIFEEEYIIDSNGNQKFLCIKRIGDEDNIKGDENIRIINSNKRALTSSNLLNSIKNKNFKNNKKLIIGNSNIINNKKKKIEAKTVYFSPQMSYENIFSPSRKSSSRIKDIKDIKNIKTKSFLNNVIKVKDKSNDFPNSKSCIFKFDQNNKFHQINYNKNKKMNINLHHKKENEEKNRISNKYNKIHIDNIIIPKQIKKKYDIDKPIIINNSRNYTNNNFINSNEYNDKEIFNKMNLNNAISEKSNNQIYIYNTTNFENNKIYIAPQVFSNLPDSNNFKYHEIKSVSKDRKSSIKINNNAKNKNNTFYFESQNKKQKFIPCISMDNIKIKKKSHSRIVSSINLKNNDAIEKKNYKILYSIPNINIGQQNKPYLNKANKIN